MAKNQSIVSIVIGLIVFGFVPNLKAQTAMNPAIKNITISSPNAASLGKYGDIPVSYHTGIPNIDIPIYTVKSGSLELPIGISYHASGLKVQEQASWVGAGWALNAGGVITRSVLGAPDDKGLQAAYTQKGHFTDYGYNSYIFSAGPATCSSNPNVNGPAQCPQGRSGMSPTTYAPQDSYVQAGIYDGEPDLYFFNFNGHSGKFYFNDDRVPVIVPKQDLKITPIYPGNDWRGMTGFTITTADGTQYYFGKNQENDGNVDAIEETYNISTQQQFTGQGATSSWFLNKIVSADGQFSINLIYQSESYSQYSLSMYPIPGVRNPNWWAYNNEYDLDKNFINGVRLSKIVFPNGEVDFNTGNLRQDLSKGLGAYPNYTYAGLSDMDNTDVTLGARALGNISVVSASVCKKYTLYTSYFYDNSSLTGNLFTLTYPNNAFNLHTDQYRLRLDSIQESSCNNSLSVPPYIFSYNTGTVPRKLSFGVDHWGFYNGVTTNTGLIPTYTIVPQGGQQGSNTSAVTIVQGANRDASWPAMAGGALTQIKYPTGGTSAFEFEPHNIYGITSSYQNVTLSNMFLHMYGQSGNTTTNSFTVNGTTNSVSIAMTSTCNFSCTLVIKDNNGVTVYNSGLPNWDGFTGTNVNAQNTINLSPGNYTATLALDNQANNSTVTGSVQTIINQYQNVTSNASMLVGGLRIKSVTNYDGVNTNNNVVTAYGYNYNNTTNGQSSATLYSTPVYVQGLRNDVWGAVGAATCSINGCFTCFGSNVAYYQSPSSIRPMANTQGNHIGYGEVYVSQASNGYSKYQYYSTNGNITGPGTPLQTDVCVRTLNTLCDPNIPNSPAVPLPFDPMRGELAAEYHFNQAGQLLKSSSYYPLWKPDSIITPGIISRFFVTAYQITSGNSSYPGNFTDIEVNVPPNSIQPVGVQTFSEYFLQSSKKIRDSVVTKTYDPSTGAYLTEIKASYYNSRFHTGPTKTLSISSKGEQLVTNITSAFDYGLGYYTPPTDPLPAYYSNLGLDNSYLSSAYGSFSLSPSDPYYYWNRLYIYNNFRYMKAVDRQNYISARLSYDVNYASVHASAKSTADAELKPVYELQDEYSNPVIETASWKNNSFTGASFTHYDYATNPSGFVYPVKVQAVNLSAPAASFTNSSVSGTSIAKDSRYTDETTAKYSGGNLVEITPKSGVTTAYLWGYKSQYPVAKISGTTYDIAKTYITQSILDNPADDATLLNNLKNLLNIPGAIVNTYTYKPLAGISNETDTRGRKMSYSYDALNRLQLVTDNDGNLLKKICYNYAGQPENCLVNCTNFTANWQNTSTALRCQVNSCGGYTGYQEQEQRDMNICSPTYNQTQWVNAGYNPSACAVSTCTALTSTNTFGGTNYAASYYNTTTGITYNLPISTASGLQNLGSIPAGTYNLTISTSNPSPPYITFYSGCGKKSISGTSATFFAVAVSSTTCNAIKIDNVQ
ncbi:MAG: hypothetical protein JST86_11610 [Bacteroidetes bacterium]|nr:hypothetical protein [Bacteroidota bacterium]